MLLLSFYVLMFLLLSGLLALVDAAVLSVTRAETEEMVLQKKSGAVWLQAVKKQMTRAVVVIVIVTNTINVLGPILVGQKAVEIYGNTVIGVITAVLTLGTIIFSEIIPKSLGAHYAPTISRYAAPVIVGLWWGLFPIVILLERMVVLLQRGERHIGTETQIRSLVKLGLQSGRIEPDESQLIHQAFLLNDRTAADIMTRRENVVTIPANATIREAAQTVFAHEFSRYPVLGEESDDIQGMVLSRQILARLADGSPDAPVKKLIQPVPRVPPDMRSDALLAMFRRRKVHLATVHDSGRLLGLVTLEDVLEELVGEIEDEKDVP
ncbi:Magnesium and cobalt efflux protein CorC [Maioricimonas rarisocia]|uniref:Magnesium and cobalt efflux protein CorC n=1 Tax=Maioricimonas rarisocia TaxID=2528026 RepID=A0A517Z4E6_9PLAN|nr:CNNM domain-containing protein [Maioricimonas rarisocia]QDU37354.1 Magnesium and cobalt efflux protein CorC [Maioricimonas rarisocia]